MGPARPSPWDKEPDRKPVALKIEDYALIGDTHTAALVGLDGSIDWLCLPRFDSPAVFAALVGKPENGRWLLAPKGPVRRARRRYVPDTLVLETDFETETGAVRVTDLMPGPVPGSRADIQRMIRGLWGRVEMRTELAFRFDYGRIIPWVQRKGDDLLAISGPDALVLRSSVPLHGENMRTVGDFTLAKGQQAAFCLTWFASHQEVPGHEDYQAALEGTVRWWRDWIGRCRYDGLWSEQVRRSLITLKALTYSPTGGILAAPTTSLPEQIGGVRNWDYRYCWLRDSTFTLYALMSAGYLDEAKQWRDWLMRAIAGSPDQLQVLYGVAGERHLQEFEVPWLGGYEGSQPVRVGNEARMQVQLDIYGEIMDSFHVARKMGLEHDGMSWQMQKVLLDYLEGHWHQADEGLWEVRGPKRHFTHSNLMAWVAVDRSIKDLCALGLDGPLDRWKALRAEIRQDICSRGFDPGQNSFVQYYGGSELDAALLMIPMVGFLPHTDPRVLGTIATIERRLMVDGLIRRYSDRGQMDGLPPGEGAFLACSFWYVDNLVMQGRQDEAMRLFEHLVSLANDVGLMAEEYDTRLGRQCGNFPQAFSHVGLVNSAQNLTSAHGPARQRAEEE